MKSFALRELRSRLVPTIVVALLSHRAVAEDAPNCDDEVARTNLVACAQAKSPALASELASLRAGEGRREAARPFLPSNPALSGSVASRASDDARAFNWYVTLSQELEVGGQSGLRVEAAEGELSALSAQVLVMRAEVAEQVWLAYFEVLAAKERAALARQVSKAVNEVAATVRGMAVNGLAAPVDATVSDSAAVRSSREVLEAERAVGAAEVRLGALLGLASKPTISGDLQPLLRAAASPVERPEAAALKAMRQASSRRIELLRRGRVPNPTISLFAQNDGFNERVFGVGLGLPIPLPQPLGRTAAGEIAEAVAFEDKQQADLQKLERSLAAELAVARLEYDAGAKILALYSVSRKAEATQALMAIATQLGAARFSVREALNAQQALVELLKAEVDARQSLCVASVRLVRANGGSLEGRDL